jgi:hypothetical protein
MVDGFCYLLVVVVYFWRVVMSSNVKMPFPSLSKPIMRASARYYFEQRSKGVKDE